VCLPGVEVTVYISAEVRYSWGKLLAHAKADFSTQVTILRSVLRSVVTPAFPPLPLPKRETGGKEYRGSPSGRK
jgi:hypothetical protein